MGVVLRDSKTGAICSRIRKSTGRIKATFPDLEREAFVTAMRSVERGIKRASKTEGGLLPAYSGAAAFARRVLASDDSSLQWSPEGSGLSDNLSATLDRLYGRFVSRYEQPSKHRKSDEDVWRPVRDGLLARGVALKLEPKVIASPTDQIEFKHAWKNGFWHAYEPVSMDLVDSDGIKDKARRWRGHLDAVNDGGITEQFVLHLILGAPTNPDLTPAFNKAIDILSKAPFSPKIYQENQIGDLVEEIEDDYRAHEASAD